MTALFALGPLGHLAALAGPADFDGFRQHARALLVADVPPEEIEWRTDGDAVPAPAEAVPGVTPVPRSECGLANTGRT